MSRPHPRWWTSRLLPSLPQLPSHARLITRRRRPQPRRSGQRRSGRFGMRHSKSSGQRRSGRVGMQRSAGRESGRLAIGGRSIVGMRRLILRSSASGACSKPPEGRPQHMRRSSASGACSKLPEGRPQRMRVRRRVWRLRPLQFRGLPRCLHLSLGRWHERAPGRLPRQSLPLPSLGLAPKPSTPTFSQISRSAPFSVSL